MVTAEDKLQVFEALDELRDAGIQLEACLSQVNPVLKVAAVHNFQESLYALEESVNNLMQLTPNK